MTNVNCSLKRSPCDLKEVSKWDILKKDKFKNSFFVHKKQDFKEDSTQIGIIYQIKFSWQSS